jgi:outer membrane usher protein
VTGAGTARIVLRDALGRETVSELPFYASTRLLAAGLADFSAEAGLPRRRFGAPGDGYGGGIVGSGSLRYGLSDRVTLEGHAEGGAGLVNAGFGLAAALGGFGTVSFGAAASRTDRGFGLQPNAAVELGYRGVQLTLRGQRSFAAYADLAAVTATAGTLPAGVLPPKSLTQATLTAPLGFDSARIGISYAAIRRAAGDDSRILGLSWSRPLPGRATLYASAFAGLERGDGFGLFAGLTIPFGGDVTASAGATPTRHGSAPSVDIARSERAEPGGIGWRLRDVEGARPARLAAASWRSGHGRIEAGAETVGNHARGYVQADGALVLAGGGAFAAERIDDAFAVVDVGVPDIAVRHDNRPAGRTDSAGRLLVPRLVAFEPNRLSIDPTGLPLDTAVARTAASVVPANGGGVTVAFGAARETAAALVAFVGPDGKPLPAGAAGRHADGTAFVVGYGGEAWLRGLGPANSVAIALDDGRTCRADFAFRPQPGGQPHIGGVACRPEAGR